MNDRTSGAYFLDFTAIGLQSDVKCGNRSTGSITASLRTAIRSAGLGPSNFISTEEHCSRISCPNITSEHKFFITFRGVEKDWLNILIVATHTDSISNRNDEFAIETA